MCHYNNSRYALSVNVRLSINLILFSSIFELSRYYIRIFNDQVYDHNTTIVLV